MVALSFIAASTFSSRPQVKLRPNREVKRPNIKTVAGQSGKESLAMIFPSGLFHGKQALRLARMQRLLSSISLSKIYTCSSLCALAIQSGSSKSIEAVVHLPELLRQHRYNV